MDEEMKRLLAMREEQDRQLAAIEAQLRALGDVQIAIPAELLEEMENVMRAPSMPMAAPIANYLRG